MVPEIIKDWDSLTYEQKKKMSEVTNFYCGLHSYVQAAELEDKIIKEAWGVFRPVILELDSHNEFVAPSDLKYLK